MFGFKREEVTYEQIVDNVIDFLQFLLKEAGNNGSIIKMNKEFIEMKNKWFTSNRELLEGTILQTYVVIITKEINAKNIKTGEELSAQLSHFLNALIRERETREKVAA